MKRTGKLSHFLALMLSLLLLLPAAGLAQDANHFPDGVNNAISCIEGYQGKLYSLQMGGVYTFTPEAWEPELVTDAYVYGWSGETGEVDALLSDETSLYVMSFMRGELVRILENGALVAPQTVLTLGDIGWPNDVFLQAGTLYWTERAEEGMLLNACTLADQQRTQLDIGQAESVSGYRGTDALAVAQREVEGENRWFLNRLDLASGDMEPLCELSSGYAATGYDADNDRVYVSWSGTLNTWQEGADALTLAAYTMGGDAMEVTAISGTVAAVLVDGNIAIRDTANLATQRSLTLCQPYGRGSQYQAFLTKHPDTAMVLTGPSELSPEAQFIQDMANRSGEIDLYRLTDPNLIATISSKEYFVDLGESDIIASAVADMYAPYQGLFQKENGIVGIPQDLYLMMIGYREEFFTDFDFEVPTDVEGLLALSRLWLADYAFDNENIRFDPLQDGIELPLLLERYADECTAAGKALHYDTPELEALLNGYLETVTAYSDYEYTGDYSFGVMNIIYVPHSYLYEYLPLSIVAGNQPIISGADTDMMYYVVNPFSEKKELAISFLEDMVTSWEPRLKMLLQKSAAHAVVDENVVAEIDALNAELAELQVKLDASGDDAILASELTTQIGEVQQRIEDNEEYRWQIKQEEVDWYQTVVDRIVFSDLNPIGILSESQPDLFDRFLDGAITAKQFLEMLDERVRSVTLEYQ